jgi:hypothetical protein
MGFTELERRYAELDAQWRSGQLSDEEFRAAVDGLRTEDELGRLWAIGAESGRWYVYQDDQWVEQQPPGSLGSVSCVECGAPLQADAPFCDTCGALVEHAPPPPAAPPPLASSASGPRRGLVIGGIVAGGLVLLTCLGLGVYALVAPSSPLRETLPLYATFSPLPEPVCTPPNCAGDETVYCPGDCPGGCGTLCVTLPPRSGDGPGEDVDGEDVDGEEIAMGEEPSQGEEPAPVTNTPQPVCTPPACGEDEIIYCPETCPGGCGVTCSTVTPSPSSTPTPEPTAQTPTATAGSVTQAPPSPTASPTSGVSPTPRPAGFITGFEAFGTWTRGDEPHGTFTQQSDRVHGGAFAADLSYNLPSAGNDFVVFLRDIPLGGQPNVIRAWVLEDGSGNFLNVWFRDAEGERWQATFGRLTGTGWRQREAIIQTGQPWPWTHIDGPSDDEIDYPISFAGLVLDGVEGGPRTGSIAIDDLSYATVANLPTPSSASGSSTGSGGPCTIEAWGWFDGALTLTPGMGEKIGCATAEVETLAAATQDFQDGIMLWRADDNRIHVFYDAGGYQEYSDTWETGTHEQDPQYGPPPEGYVQPRRGFGLVWEENETVRDRLGWGVNKERPCDDAHVQSFERGVMVSCTHDVVPSAKIYVFTLYDDSTYALYMP